MNITSVDIFYNIGSLGFYSIALTHPETYLTEVLKAIMKYMTICSHIHTALFHLNTQTCK